MHIFCVILFLLNTFFSLSVSNICTMKQDHHIHFSPSTSPNTLPSNVHILSLPSFPLLLFYEYDKNFQVTPAFVSEFWLAGSCAYTHSLCEEFFFFLCNGCGRFREYQFTQHSSTMVQSVSFHTKFRKHWGMRK